MAVVKYRVLRGTVQAAGVDYPPGALVDLDEEEGAPLCAGRRPVLALAPMLSAPVPVAEPAPVPPVAAPAQAQAGKKRSKQEAPNG